MLKDMVLSFTAGIIIFLSPCVLPLIPAYISYITGSSADSRIENRSKYTAKILLFIAGFTIVFVTLGVITSLISFFAVGNVKRIFNIAFGILIIIFSFHYMGIIKFLFLNQEKRFHFSRLPSGYTGAFLIGMAFAAGWTPCIGPVLGATLGLVASGQSILKGVFLLIIFSLGIGVPLLLTALFFNSFKPFMNFIKRNSDKVKIFSGIILLFIGLLVIFGALDNIIIYTARLAYFIEDHAQISSIIISMILLAAGLLSLIPMIIKKRFSISWTISASIFIILGVLNFTGILPLASLLINYLTFQGR